MPEQDQQDQQRPTDIIRSVRFKLAAELAWFVDRNGLDGTPASEPIDQAESERRLAMYSKASAAVRDLAVGLDALDSVIDREPIPVENSGTLDADVEQLVGRVWNVVSEAGHPTAAADYAAGAVRAALGDQDAELRLRAGGLPGAES